MSKQKFTIHIDILFFENNRHIQRGSLIMSNIVRCQIIFVFLHPSHSLKRKSVRNFLPATLLRRGNNFTGG
jgi:hypothetical protein